METLMHELAAAIAKELCALTGKQWWVRYPQPNTVHLIDEEGRKLMVSNQYHTTWQTHDRLVIKGAYPVAADGTHFVSWHDEAPLITVAARRDGAAIAKDIHRRFLWRFMDMWKAILARIEEHETYGKRMAEMAQAIAKAAGSVVEKDGSVRIYTEEGYGKFAVATKVRLELFSLTYEKALQIAALFKE